MSALPPRHRIRNFSDDLEAPWLFRSETLALRALFADPTLYNLGAEQARLPTIGHLGTLSGSRMAGVGLLGSHSLEMRIGASLQSLFQYYEWHNKIVKGENVQAGEMPTFSVIAADIATRPRGMLNDATAELRQQDDESRASHADDLTKEMYKTLLLEVGTLHVLLHQEGAQDAVSEIRTRHAKHHQQQLQSPFLRKLFIEEPVNRDELHEVQRRVDRIYTNLQQALCTAIPEAAMVDAMEHPFSATLVKHSLEQIRQLYFHMYSANGQEQTFANRLLGIQEDPAQRRR